MLGRVKGRWPREAGERPARTRHCDRAKPAAGRRGSHWDAAASREGAEGARKPGDLPPAEHPYALAERGGPCVRRSLGLLAGGLSRSRSPGAPARRPSRFAIEGADGHRRAAHQRHDDRRAGRQGRRRRTRAAAPAPPARSSRHRRRLGRALVRRLRLLRVETIAGRVRTPPPRRRHTGRFYLNGYAAPAGVCRASCSRATSARSSRPSTTPTRAPLLDLSGVPATAAPGAPVTVTVKRSRRPYGGRRTTCRQRRRARGRRDGRGRRREHDHRRRRQGDAHADHRGPSTLRRRSAGDVRSASERVCVDRRRRRLLRHDRAGRPASRPRPPAARCAARRPRGSLRRRGLDPRAAALRRGKAPRELTGSVAGEPSGIKRDPPAADAPRAASAASATTPRASAGSRRRAAAPTTRRSSRSATARRGRTCCRRR